MINNTFSIIEVKEYDLNGEEKRLSFKVNVEAQTTLEHFYYETVKNKTFSSYGDARKFISEKFEA